MIFQSAVMLGADNTVEIRRPNLDGVVQFVEITFTVGHHHQLSTGHTASGRSGYNHGIQPAHAFLLVDRLSIARSCIVRLPLPTPAGLGIQYPEGNTIRAIGQQAMEKEPLTALLVDGTQATGLAQPL